jgi:hypothetical protein
MLASTSRLAPSGPDGRRRDGCPQRRLRGPSQGYRVGDAVWPTLSGRPRIFQRFTFLNVSTNAFRPTEHQPLTKRANPTFGTARVKDVHARLFPFEPKSAST